MINMSTYIMPKSLGMTGSRHGMSDEQKKI